jgi:hypothetical protein
MAANDSPASATPIASLPATITQSTVGATDDPADPKPWGTASGYVWFTLTVAEDTDVTVDTYGSDYATGIGVYHQDGRLVNRNVTSPVPGEDRSWMDWVAQAGVTYLIGVGGWQGASGTLTLNARSAVGLYPDDTEWPVMPAADWDYNFCDPADHNRIDLSIAVNVWWWWDEFSDGPWDSVYWELYEEPGGRRAAVAFHLADATWANIVCPATPATLRLGVDPHWPDGPTGGWSADVQPEYVRSKVEPEVLDQHKQFDYVVAARLYPDAYYPEVDQACWEAVIDYTEPLEINSQTIGPGGLEWANGAERTSQLVPEYWNVARYKAMRYRTIGKVTATREVWPTNLNPALIHGRDFYAEPGTWWRGARYMRHITRPRILAAGVIYEAVQGSALPSIDSDNWTHPIDFTVEAHGAADEGSFTAIELRPGPDPDATMTFRSHEIGGLPELLSGATAVPSERVEGREDLVIEMPSIKDIGQQIIDAGLWDGDGPGPDLVSAVSLYVDPDLVRNRTPPPWGGSGAWLAGSREHLLSFSGWIRLWFQIEWGKWQYWVPDAGADVLVTVLMTQQPVHLSAATVPFRVRIGAPS